MTTGKNQRARVPDVFTVEVKDDCIRIHGEMYDPDLASVLEGAGEHTSLVLLSIIRMGRLAYASARDVSQVEYVKREFDRMRREVDTGNEAAADALAETLRSYFAEEGGRLPDVMERYMGDRGLMRKLVDELLDEDRKDSAIGRFQTVLGQYFGGDRSVLAGLLDPTREGSPLHQFSKRVDEGFQALSEQLVAFEASKRARSAERAISTGKGFDFEDAVEAFLGEALAGFVGVWERTSESVGAIPDCRKGDFTIAVRTDSAAEVGIVLEVKNSWSSWPKMRREVAQAKENRNAAVAIIVVSSEHAPSGLDLIQLIDDDVWVVVDPEDETWPSLDAALRLAQLVARAATKHDGEDIDAAAVRTILGGVRIELDRIRAMKRHLTSMGTLSTDVARQLDELRAGILARIDEAEHRLTSESDEEVAA